MRYVGVATDLTNSLQNHNKYFLSRFETSNGDIAQRVRKLLPTMTLFGYHHRHQTASYRLAEPHTFRLWLCRLHSRVDRLVQRPSIEQAISIRLANFDVQILVNRLPISRFHYRSKRKHIIC